MKHTSENIFQKTAQSAAFIAATVAPVAEVHAESSEGIKPISEKFTIEVSAEKTFIEMPNGVLFLGEEGKPIAVVPAMIIGG